MGTRSNSRLLVQWFAIVSATLLLVAASMTALAATKITVMSRSWDENYDTAVSMFTEKTGIEVEIVNFRGWNELREKVAAMAAGGVSPDVIYHDNGAQGDFVAKGLTSPIDDLVEKYNLDLSIWPKPVIEAYRFEGKLYSLPTGVSPYLTYYNVDKFNEVGLAEIPADWNSSDWTWDDMKVKARKLSMDRDGDGTNDQYAWSGFLNYGFTGIHLWNLDWISSDLTQFQGNSPDVVKAISEMTRLYTEMNVIGGGFSQGSAAMATDQINFLTNMERLSLDGGFFTWRVAPLPKAVSRNTATGFHSFGISPDSRYRDEAFKFIRFMTTDPEGARLFNLAEKRLPVLPSTIKAWVNRWDSTLPGIRAEVFTNGLANVYSSNMWRGLPIQIYQDIRGALIRITNGEIAPQAAMDEIKPNVQAMLQEAAEVRAKR